MAMIVSGGALSSDVNRSALRAPTGRHSRCAGGKRGEVSGGGRDFGYNKSTKPKIPVVLQLKAEGRSIIDIAQVGLPHHPGERRPAAQTTT